MSTSCASRCETPGWAFPANAKRLAGTYATQRIQVLQRGALKDDGVVLHDLPRLGLVRGQQVADGIAGDVAFLRDVLNGLNGDESSLDIRQLNEEGRETIVAPLLATWVVHDLSHHAQISRVLARQYTEAVGPWRAYLPLLG